MTSAQRLGVGSRLLAFSAIGLFAASVAILFPFPGVSDRVGRHLLAGALANVALSLILFALALIPIRQGQRWAMWCFAVCFLVYGLPIFVIDALNVTRGHLLATLAPQAMGVFLGLTGLALVVSATKRQSNGTYR